MTIHDLIVRVNQRFGLVRADPRDLTLTDFKRRVFRGYQNAPHLALLDAHLTAVTRHIETAGADGIGHLIIALPPRHGKTLLTSQLYPAWHLGRNPAHSVILASYGATLAHKNSRAVRNLVARQRYRDLFPGVGLAADSQKVDSWRIAHYEGGMDAVGVGGGVTGKGAHLIIVDDPVKSREEAESQTMRDKVWDWFTDDLYTRREPGAGVIVIMTRWHSDDLVGRLLQREAEKWTLTRLPAIAEDDDPLGRKVGAPLWKRRFSSAALDDIRGLMGDYSWSALYQQRPIPAQGNIFKRGRLMPFVDDVPAMEEVVRFWDLAMSAATSADYTVGVKIGRGVDGHYYVLDVARAQLDWGSVVPFLARVMLADGESVAQGVEQTGFMARAVQELNADERLHGHQVWGYPVDTDKLTRALPFAAKCGAGLVRVVNAGWSADFIDELCSFPNSAHDDQVDASSGAWAMLGAGFTDFGSIAYAGYGTLDGEY